MVLVRVEEGPELLLVVTQTQWPRLAPLQTIHNLTGLPRLIFDSIALFDKFFIQV